MILIADRRSSVQDIQIAGDAGARLNQVCAVAGIDARIVLMLAEEGVPMGKPPARAGPRPPKPKAHPHRNGTSPSLVLGHDPFTRNGCWPLV
jgi:hypothetical protein